jgi:hypothetical protein
VLQEQEYEMLRSEYGDDALTAKMGARAIREILSEMDLEEMTYNIQEGMYLESESGANSHGMLIAEVQKVYRRATAAEGTHYGSGDSDFF